MFKSFLLNYLLAASVEHGNLGAVRVVYDARQPGPSVWVKYYPDAETTSTNRYWGLGGFVYARGKIVVGVLRPAEKSHLYFPLFRYP